MGCSLGVDPMDRPDPSPTRPRSPRPVLRRGRGPDRHARRVHRDRARHRPQLPRHRDQGSPRRPRRAAARRGARPLHRAGHRPVRGRRRRRHPGAHRGRGRRRSAALQGGRGQPLRSAPARPADPRVRRDGGAAADAGTVRHDAAGSRRSGTSSARPAPSSSSAPIPWPRSGVAGSPIRSWRSAPGTRASSRWATALRGAARRTSGCGPSCPYSVRPRRCRRRSPSAARSSPRCGP